MYKPIKRKCNVARSLTLGLMLWIALFLLVFNADAAEKPTVSGRISRVTVYRGQALVTRNIEVGLPAGTTELTVTDLPQHILPETIYAQTSDNLTVLSVRYRERAVREDTREEVKELDCQIEQLRREMFHTETEAKHTNEMWGMFVKLQDFSIKATNEDLNRALLEFEPLQELTAHIEEKGTIYQAQILKLHDKMQAQKKEMDLL